MANKQGRGVVGRLVTVDGGKQEWRLEKVIFGGSCSSLTHFIRRGQRCGWVQRSRLRFVRGKFSAPLKKGDVVVRGRGGR